MERQPQSGATPALTLRLHWSALLALMLLPWLWVSIGLWGLKSYAMTIGLYEGLGCALPLLLFQSHRRRVAHWRWPSLAVWGLITTTHLLILLIFHGTLGFGMDWPVFDDRAQSVGLRFSPLFWLSAAWIVLINPFLEEYFWRGLVYEGWKRYLRPSLAAAVSAFFFGAWHWLVLHYFCSPGWDVFLSLAVMGGGLIFAYLYEKSQGLSDSILLHALGADLPMAFVAYACLINSAR